MKFMDMPYQRIDMEKVKTQYETWIQQLKSSQQEQEIQRLFQDINALRNQIQTQMTLCQIRHTINTADPFYDQENAFYDENGPVIQNLDAKFMDVCLLPHIHQVLKKSVPETFFQLAQYTKRVVSEEILDELVKENQLTTKYGALKASAKIEFEGKTYTLSQIDKLTQSLDRQTRQKAYLAKMHFYEQHQEDFDDIFDQLVAIRTQMARKLGFENYIEMAYLRMYRLDYDAKDVQQYRQEILKHVVPVASRIYENQAKRLGLSQLAFYDLPIQFQDGNATPKGTPKQLVEAAQTMYHQMHPETGKFIDTMIQDELWDLESKPNKEMGGYMTCIPEYKVPFIFSNFNGTSGDVDVLTHEAGHAFQYYVAKDIEVLDVVMPTVESCEIDSMSMEFFAHPYIDVFFKEDSNKYRLGHLESTITFLPYGCLVDHFQHEVYAHPNWSKAERKACWRTLEKQYQPYKNYTGCPILEEGCWWYQQGHIFQSPFYYIDYTLAQVCAHQFFIRSTENDPSTFQDYLHLLALGGTLPFQSLVKEANLKSPFEKGTIQQVMQTLETYLKQQAKTLN